MMGVDDSVADLESHVTSTPSATDKGSTLQGPAEPTLQAYAQVRLVIRLLTNDERHAIPLLSPYCTGPSRSDWGAPAHTAAEAAHTGGGRAGRDLTPGAPDATGRHGTWRP